MNIKRVRNVLSGCNVYQVCSLGGAVIVTCSTRREARAFLKSGM